MFHVFAAGKENCVKFKHEYKTVNVIQKNGIIVDQRRPVKTHCFIVAGENTLGKGVASCDPRDHFEYVKGRKYALKRALIDAGFNKVDRKNVWDAFNSN